MSIWQDEYTAWKKRSLADCDYVYVWVDGVHFGVRLEDERLCALVVIGARPDGTKEVVAVEDGYRESKDNWQEVRRDLKRRGMRAPRVATGDGALGFWAAVRDVWPTTREERCWVHKIANVLDKLPRSIQPKAKAKLHEAMNAPTCVECDKAIDEFVETYQTKYPKATTSLVDGRAKLVTHFDFPAEHWQHLRTTNPIESTFATVKLRQRVTKGAGSRAAGLAMAFKLLLAVERTWRRLNGREQWLTSDGDGVERRKRAQSKVGVLDQRDERVLAPQVLGGRRLQAPARPARGTSHRRDLRRRPAAREARAGSAQGATRPDRAPARGCLLHVGTRRA